MSSTPEVEQSGGTLPGFSCSTCRQRKIKCDRRTPCSNCIKTGAHCNFIAPARNKRRRTKPPKEGLHARLKRYERLLRSYGAQLEPSEYENDTDGLQTISEPDVESIEETPPPNKERKSFDGLGEPKPLLTTNEGETRYLDGYVVSSTLLAGILRTSEPCGSA